MSAIPGARTLFAQLRDAGSEAAVVAAGRWLDVAGSAYRSWLEQVCSHADHTEDMSADPSQSWMLKELYALSRVSEVLLLSFQPKVAFGARQPWAHQLHPPTQWPRVALDQYLAVFTALGMTPVSASAFDPFLHEIVAVDQCAEPDAPITVERELWPALMLGELLFSRAGVVVRAGRDQARRGFADAFPLYWTFLRGHRATLDLSLGWGHNSQWRTDFRRDYRTAEADHLNVDARPAGTTQVIGLDDEHDGEGERDPDAAEPLLSPAERRELLRNRCLLRPPAASARLAAVEAWELNLWPYDWRLSVPRMRAGEAESVRP